MEFTREEFAKLVKKEVVRELKEIWGPEVVDRMLTEQSAQEEIKK